MADKRVEVADVTSGRHSRFVDGSERWVVTVGPSWIGRGVYLPGWRWTKDVQPEHGLPSAEHLGYILSGQMAVRSADGDEVVVSAGEAWFSGPGHDAWVVGDHPCVALDFPTA
jgi:hypothetical protein